jgi:catechol 2,3-dioxygenase-like lactoylglutathione lyase family enzyme
VPIFIAAEGVSNEDLATLPVRELQTAIAFYTRVLGFVLIRSDRATATLARDGIQIGLVVDSAHDPGRAGSLAIETDDLETLHRDLARAGATPGVLDTEDWNGRSYRTFFLREEADGYCYCFYQAT